MPGTESGTSAYVAAGLTARMIAECMPGTASAGGSSVYWENMALVSQPGMQPGMLPAGAS